MAAHLVIYPGSSLIGFILFQPILLLNLAHISLRSPKPLTVSSLPSLISIGCRCFVPTRDSDGDVSLAGFKSVWECVRVKVGSSVLAQTGPGPVPPPQRMVR